MRKEIKQNILAQLKPLLKGWKYTLSYKDRSLTLTVTQGTFDLVAHLDSGLQDGVLRLSSCGIGGERIRYLLNATVQEKREAVHSKGDKYGKFASIGFADKKDPEILQKILGIMNQGNWDDSDRSSDYFNFGWMSTIEFGRRACKWGEEGTAYEYISPEALEARVLDKAIKPATQTKKAVRSL
jgi:hypothetical protein